ncbi:MAG: hypothetical protein ACP5G8_09365 [Athalassotoga sp.]
MALTGEDQKITNVRKVFGSSTISSITLKRVLFGDLYPLYKIKEDEKTQIRNEFEKILDNTKGVNLPDDLEFIRRMVEVGLSKIIGSAKTTDFITLSNIYSKLWFDERKQEGLENILPRFWGMAGISDLK